MQLNVNKMKKQLAGKPKQIGDLDGKPVYGLLTKGGLSLIAHLNDDGDLKVLGAGSHAMIARSVARQEHSKINFSELSKSESTLPEDILNRYLPTFTEFTRELQKVADKK